MSINRILDSSLYYCRFCLCNCILFRYYLSWYSCYSRHCNTRCCWFTVEKLSIYIWSPCRDRICNRLLTYSGCSLTISLRRCILVILLIDEHEIKSIVFIITRLMMYWFACNFDKVVDIVRFNISLSSYYNPYSLSDLLIPKISLKRSLSAWERGITNCFRRIMTY